MNNEHDGTDDEPRDFCDLDKLEVVEEVVEIELDFSKYYPHDFRNSDTLGMGFD